MTGSYGILLSFSMVIAFSMHLGTHSMHMVQSAARTGTRARKTPMEFSYDKKEDLVRWIDKWREFKGLDFSMEHKHFFLEGRHLDDISKELVSHAESEVLVVNPFVENCDLSNTLRQADAASWSG